MSQSRTNLLGLLVIGAILCVLVAGLGSLLSSVYAAGSQIHEIRGTVASVSPSEDPPVIMVRSVSGSSEEIVVGAVLKQGSTILLGKKRIGLDRLRPGDDVTLKYSKTRDGLVVRSIVLHRH
ncbi:hypothetical protein FBQ96_03390 [Nitrospirales bacterium NOB]|nr:MAG: hypothetical protein UZ03_NOB001000756 [Nitrospira sp. OLB3]MBV6469585.1 hypothetical protein [Nitrospirota bacterium]MCE7965379.1 hypothetical protein [Nitrospira sp. NTP2]MCK6493401.1 hypothetical protein [Nitrospira sp.]MDL1888622.1 hypothetical protein [Nitrospirales bacterium NOB]MEB2338953.1 hypothetical protein [Nitrospirales bacterium]NGZ04316.1 hypothetical protein [Nitrospira sp. WS238]